MEYFSSYEKWKYLNYTEFILFFDILCIPHISKL
jgi:hypothetical protein